MDFKNKATKIELFSFNSPQMRAFHVTWFAFFLCFFGWFGIVPLMKGDGGVIATLGLNPAQVGNSIIAAVSLTIIARLIIGRCVPGSAREKVLHSVAGAGIAAGDVHRPRADAGPIHYCPRPDRHDRRFFRYHPIPHERHVCSQCSGARPNAHARLGQSGRWRYPGRDAASPCRCADLCARGNGLAGGDGGSRACHANHGSRLLVPDPGRA